MPEPKKNEKNSKICVFADFIPAELRQSKDWIIVYYAKNPVTNKLERQRLRVSKIKSNSERLRFAKQLVVEINGKLREGWSPFISNNTNGFKSWNDAIADFRKYIEKQFQENIFRSDTIRTYNSNLNLVLQFIEEKKMKMTFALQLNKNFCVQYLDWIYLERGNSARTRNNHLIFVRLLGNYFLQRGILSENPTASIKNFKKTEKVRTYIPKETREKILTEIIGFNSGYYCLCLTIYYCMIRNTELGKITVDCINLENDTIFISGEISKNKKDEIISIPEPLKKVLSNHIKNATANDFVFSADNFYTGVKKMPIRKIQNYWDKLRLKINLKKEYQFYSLKDTGITDLFLAGLPAIAIKNQARHSNISITELYTPKNMKCDDFIKNSGIKF